jgi:hypothetical protein
MQGPGVEHARIMVVMQIIVIHPVAILLTIVG